jgi:predicted DCC family thiol-disulfide oxidoreductase YuxK
MAICEWCQAFVIALLADRCHEGVLAYLVEAGVDGESLWPWTDSEHDEVNALSEVDRRGRLGDNACVG